MSEAANLRPSLAGVWWMHPGVALAMPAIIVLAAAIATPTETYALFWKTGKFIDRATWLSGMGCVAAFLFGTLLFPVRKERTGRRPPGDSIPWYLVRRLVTFSFALCIAGYCFWAVAALRHGITVSLLLDGITGRNGATYKLRDEYLVPVSGVTTLTQFGIAVVAFGVPAALFTGWKGIRGKMIVIFLLAAFRAAVNSERLALIELAVPGLIGAVAFRNLLGRVSKRERILTAIAPVVGAIALFLIFSGFEYGRSWQFYSNQQTSFWRFTAFRLVGYYSTAVNNGALLVRSLPQATGFPYFTATFAWKFPILNKAIEAVLPPLHFRQETFSDLLTSSANPEFNNPSGLFMPVADFGLLGGLLYWLGAGLICGYLYRALQGLNVSGVFLYPVLFTSLIEASRILYWSDGRFFPPIILVGMSVLYIVRSGSSPSRQRYPTIA